MSCVITADNGTTSGSAGLKHTADSSGALSIKVGSGSVTAATFDASGNVGIGVTPSAWTLRAIQGPDAEFVVAGLYPYVASNTYYATGWKYQTTAAASYYVQAAGSHQWFTAPSGTAGNAITFTTAMTLNANSGLEVGAYVKASTYLWAAGAGNGGGVYLGAGGANGLISQAAYGTGTTTTYIGNQAITTSSDERLKANIRPTERDALALLNQWEIIDHTWNDPSDQCENNRNSRGVWTGVRAQQVYNVTPWLVNKPLQETNEDGSISPWVMEFGYSVPLVVKAIQQLTAENTELKQRIAALEAK